MWRGVRARVLAKGGATAEAERLAREAVTRAERSDCLNHHAGALVDLAAVYRSAGEVRDELEALETALKLYERKCNVVAAEKLRARLGELTQSTVEV